MLRTIIIITFIFLFLVCSLPVLLIFKLLYKRYPTQIDRISLAMVQWALKIVVFFAGTELIVLGEENIPRNQPVLYVGNHTSFFDIIITYTRVPALTGFVSKKSMEKFPILNFWMNRVHCLFLDRDNVKEGLKTILTAIEKVKSGISIFIFPEGTRNKKKENPTDIGEFKDGSFKIASKTGCKIVPVAITGTNKIFEDHFPTIKGANVILQYGKPVTFKELDKEDQKHIGAYFQNQIHEMLIEHQNM